MFYQILLSPQVKWSVIISNKYVKYELPHELTNDPTAFSPMGGLSAHTRKKKTLGNQDPRNLEKSKNPHRIIASSPASPLNKNYSNTSKKLVKNRNLTFPVVRYFTWKLLFVSHIFFMVVSADSFLLLRHPGPLHT